jgi:hypothetical protein
VQIIYEKRVVTGDKNDIPQNQTTPHNASGEGQNDQNGVQKDPKWGKWDLFLRPDRLEIWAKTLKIGAKMTQNGVKKQVQRVKFWVPHSAKIRKNVQN